MHANLMRASGFEIHRNQRRLAESVQHVPMRDRRLARRRDAEAEVRHLGAADGRFDGGLVLLEVALDHRMIGLDHLMLGELPPHLLVRQL